MIVIPEKIPAPIENDFRSIIKNFQIKKEIIREEVNENIGKRE